MSKRNKVCTSLILQFLLNYGAIASSHNVLLNPGFYFSTNGTANPNTNALHWARYGGSARENWGGFDGDGYLATVRGYDQYPPLTHGGWYQDFDAKPGTRYVFGGFFYKDTNYTFSTADLKLEYYNKSGVMIFATTTSLAGMTSSWTYFETSSTAPSGSVVGRAAVAVEGQGATDNLLLDKFHVMENRIYGWNGSLEGWSTGSTIFAVSVDTNTPFEGNGVMRVNFNHNNGSPFGVEVSSISPAIPDLWPDYDAIRLRVRVPNSTISWASARLILQSSGNGNDTLATIPIPMDNQWHDLTFPYTWATHSSSTWFKVRLEIDLDPDNSGSLYIDGFQLVKEPVKWWDRPDWEWVAISPSSNNGCLDIDQLYAAYDHHYVYLRINFAVPRNPFSGNGFTIHVDMDHNAGTGYDLNMGGSGVFGSEAMWHSVTGYHEQASGTWIGSYLLNAHITQNDYFPYNKATTTLVVRILRSAYHQSLAFPVFGNGTSNQLIRVAVRTAECSTDYAYGSWTIRPLTPPVSEIGASWASAQILYEGTDIDVIGDVPSNGSFRTVYATFNETNLYVGLALSGLGGETNYYREIYLDTDNNVGTGYRGGASWMSQGYNYRIVFNNGQATLEKFTGINQYDYSWATVTNYNLLWSGTNSFLEIGVPLGAVGLSTNTAQLVGVRVFMQPSAGHVVAPRYEQHTQAKTFLIPFLDRIVLGMLLLAIAAIMLFRFLPGAGIRKTAASVN